MINIRGVNVYPAGIEAVVRHFAQIVEFRSIVSSHGALRSLRLEIELAPDVVDTARVAAHLAHELREALGLNVPVQAVPAGALPRFEMKASRFIVEA
jgi:phenylacetate-CoA ligase